MIFTRNMKPAQRILYAVSGFALLIVPAVFQLGRFASIALVALGAISLVESLAGY